MSFAAMAHKYEGPCPTVSKPTAHAESRKFSYLPCSHTNANSVHDGMAIYFSLENIKRNNASIYRRLE
jgi:hypothetical protein